MTNFEQQIVFSYESLGHTSAEIAMMFEAYLEGGEEEVMKVLSEHSTQYSATLREKQSAAERGEASDEELATLLSEYRVLSRSSDNDLVKERALKFLINERKGRNDLGERALKLKEAEANANVDLAKRGVEFQNAMLEINRKIQEALGARVIDISGQPKALGEAVNG